MTGDRKQPKAQEDQIAMERGSSTTRNQAKARRQAKTYMRRKERRTSIAIPHR